MDVTGIGFAVIHLVVTLVAFMIGLSVVVGVGFIALNVLLLILAMPILAFEKVIDWLKRLFTHDPEAFLQRQLAARREENRRRPR